MGRDSIYEVIFPAASPQHVVILGGLYCKIARKNQAKKANRPFLPNFEDGKFEKIWEIFAGEGVLLAREVLKFTVP